MIGVVRERARSLRWQIVGALLAWAYVASLNLSNDGLWYQGDSPRHAMNGFFWLDFLHHVPTHPMHFALGYYARYPVINPVAYPPFFYLVEGAAYAVFGALPFVGKGLVLLFLLVAAMYMTAWLRRWITPEAGWGAVLFLLQPGPVVWSSAVMLNVPSMALAVAALYHARRWLEAPESKHVYLAIVLGAIAVLTYLPIAVCMPIVVLWATRERRLLEILRPRTLLLLALPVALIATWTVLAVPWAQSHMAVAKLTSAQVRWTVGGALYYATHMTEIVSAPVLALAVVAVSAALFRSRRRREVILCVIWAVACYVWFWMITAGYAESRYLLPAVPALVCLATVGVASLADLTQARARGPLFATAVFLVLISTQAAIASRLDVRNVSGFDEVAKYVRDVAPGERVFYDGQYDGVFGFYLRGLDPDLRQAMTRGANLIYSTRLGPRYGLVERVTAERDITRVLVNECGCRIFVVEKQLAPDMTRVTAAINLRRAVGDEPFELLRTFTVTTPDVREVAVYRLPSSVVPQESAVLRFPFLGGGKTFAVEPIHVGTAKP